MEIGYQGVQKNSYNFYVILGREEEEKILSGQSYTECCAYAVYHFQTIFKYSYLI